MVPQTSASGDHPMPSASPTFFCSKEGSGAPEQRWREDPPGAGPQPSLHPSAGARPLSYPPQSGRSRLGPRRGRCCATAARAVRRGGCQWQDCEQRGIVAPAFCGLQERPQFGVLQCPFRLPLHFRPLGRNRGVDGDQPGPDGVMEARCSSRSMCRTV
jgi:hypothetical protein